MTTYTDDELIARAIAQGWEQLDAVTDRFPGSSTFPWTGWLVRGGVGMPVLPGKERTEWVGKYPNRHQVTYVDSWARLPRERLAHEDRCGECGLLIEYGGYIGFEAERAPLPFCWDCQFWVSRVAEVRAGTRRGVGRQGTPVVVDRLHGQDHVFVGIGQSRTPSSHNGYGGSWFTLTFTDGRVVETCDLWNGGQVPERFRDRLPVTATVTSGRAS